jgi:hypothetical protein
MRRCKGEEYKSMKELIYQKYLYKSENADSVTTMPNHTEEPFHNIT